MSARRLTAVLAVLAGLAIASPAAATTLTVTNTNDSGAGSLRAAIDAAGTGFGNDAIDFDPATFGMPQTIQLTSFLAIDPKNKNDALSINGPGANLLTIQAPVAGGPLLNAFHGVNTISGTTLHGTTTTGSFNATVNTDSDLTLDKVVLTGNTSDAGGNGSGGGLANFGGTATLLNSTVSGNTVNNSGPAGSGGGILNGDKTVLINSTVSGNAVHGAGTKNGGGIYNPSGAVVLVNSTVSANTADHGGGGIYQAAGSVQLANTIVAGNTADTGNDIVGTNIVSQGHNLIGNTTGSPIAAASGDLFGTSASPINAMLGPLGDNGGTTPTMALLDGSPAINAADPTNSNATPPAYPNPVPSTTTDQRGVTRPQDGGNDIGAFELVPNRIEVGKAKVNANNGTATISATVFAPGDLGVSGNGIKSQRPTAKRSAHSKPVSAAGTYKLTIKATGAKKKKLKKKGKVKVKPKITFAPTNGVPSSETAKVTLKLKK